ncbi:MAG: response regulator transcription factor [Elusimicrobia bacterium]|nr:response regulator transcription factor [Elusimicrobiota bacterium]
MKENLLIVDDDAHLRESLAEVLDLDGFKCFQAGTAKEGLEMAKLHHPQVVILDIQLPDSSGFQICQDLRRTSKQMVLIMMTGRFLSSEEKTQGFGLGADDYITKPFDLKELSVRIKQLLSRAKNK